MIGSDYPIRVQSMANTSTMDTDGSVDAILAEMTAAQDASNAAAK